jgi:hypothetical protein
MESFGFQSTLGFDEKRDYEVRRMRRANSSTSFSSTYASDSGRSRQLRNSSETSDKPLQNLPNRKSTRHVRFAVETHLPTIAPILNLTILLIHTKHNALPPLSHIETSGHGRKRRRADSTGDVAWWAQHQLQQDAQWNEEGRVSAKKTSTGVKEQDVRHLCVKIRG